MSEDSLGRVQPKTSKERLANPTGLRLSLLLDKLQLLRKSPYEQNLTHQKQNDVN